MVTLSGVKRETIRAGTIPHMSPVMTVSEMKMRMFAGVNDKAMSPVPAPVLFINEFHTSVVMSLRRIPKTKHTAVNTMDSRQYFKTMLLWLAPLSFLVAISFALFVVRATLRLI